MGYRFVWNLVVTGGKPAEIKTALEAVVKSLRTGDGPWATEVNGWSVHQPNSYENSTSVLLDVRLVEDVAVEPIAESLTAGLEDLRQAAMAVRGVTGFSHSERITRPSET